MPHDRKRHISAPFEELIRFARIVGILGHRQTGKTTFVKQVAEEFVSLDDEDELLKASRSAKNFVQELKGKKSAIDECQLVPALFPALKLFVGTSSKPGRFILTGSVRFTSREVIKESLTGRISNLELFPLVLSEIQQEENSVFFIRLLNTNHLPSFANTLTIINSLHTERMKAIYQYYTNGGLPGLFHIRKLQTRNNLLRDLLETILDRDVRLVYPTTLPYQQIFDFCREIAAQPDQPINHSAIKRATGIGFSTQKKLLRALEGVFLLRRIPMEGDLKGELFWFEDQIERFYFQRNENPNSWDWIGLIYRNARAQFSYRIGEFAQYTQYRTRGGAQVPLVIENKGKHVGVFAVENTEQVTSQLIRSAESFLKKYNSAYVLFLNHDASQKGREVRVIGERMLIAPMSVAFF